MFWDCYVQYENKTVKNILGESAREAEAGILLSCKSMTLDKNKRIIDLYTVMK